MFTKHSIYQLFTFILFTVLSFNFPKIAFAVANCDLDPDFFGSEFPLPVMSQNTCDITDDESSMFQNFLNNSVVRGVSNPQILFEGIENDNEEYRYMLNGVDGNGSAKIGLDKNTNLTIDSPILDKIGNTGNKVNREIQTLKKAVSMAEWTSAVGSNDECLGLSPLACAQKFDATIKYKSTGREGVNILKLYTFRQLMLPISQQLKDSRARNNNYIECTDKEGFANDHYCGNIYAPSGEGSSVRTLAGDNNQILDSLNIDQGLTDYYKLHPDTRRKLLAVTEPKTSEPIILVVKKKYENDFFNLIKLIFTGYESDIYIIRGSQAGLPNTVDGLKWMYKLFNTRTNGTSGMAKIEGGTVAGDTTDPIVPPPNTKGVVNLAGLSDTSIQKILQKIGDNECTPPLTYTQLLGAVADSRGTPDAEIAWDFDYADIEQAKKKEMFVYTACALESNLYSQARNLGSADPNAPMRAFYPLSYSENFTDKEDQVYFRQQLFSSPPSAYNSVDYPVGVIEVPCPENPELTCTKEDTKIMTANFGGEGSVLTLQGCEFCDKGFLNTSKKNILPLNDPERFNSCDYYGEVKKRQPIKVGYLGTDSISGKNLACPEFKPAKKTTKPKEDTEICAIAAKYNVPCDFLKAVWIIETGGADDNYDCPCTGGACGPYQIQPGEVGQVFSSTENQPDLCTKIGGAEILARILLFKKYCAMQPDGSWPSCPPGKFQPGDSQYSLSLDEVEIVGRYNGSNGCWPNDETQCRFGSGVSYCDLVNDYIDSDVPKKIRDNNCTQEFCSRIGVSCSGLNI